MQELARKALFPIAILQFAAPVLPLLGVGETIGDRATAIGIPPELPIGFFFSIWSVIFIGYFALSLFALRARDQVPDVILPTLALTGLGNVLWMLCAQSFGLAWLDFLLLIPILATAWLSARRLELAGGGGRHWGGFLSEMVTGLLAGWLCIAISVSVPDLIRSVLGLGVTDYVWPFLLSALATATCLSWLFASRFSRSWWFFAALGWGLSGAAINNWARTELHALSIATVVLGLYIFRRRQHYGARGAGA